MNNSPSISFTVGAPRQRARLSDFENVCGALRTCIKHIGRCVAGTETTDCEITGLSEGSATLECVPIVAGETNGKAADVSHAFAETIAAIRDGRELDPRLDYLAIKAFQGVCSPLTKAPLTVCGVKLTKEYKNNIEALLESDSPSLGSVSGRLEAFSLHNQCQFTLYPPITGEGVDCRFSRDDLDRVLKAVDHVVTVYGKLYYAKRKIFPSRVDVYDFEVHPSSNQLPTLLDARLDMPESSDDALRAMRDEWD